MKTMCEINQRDLQFVVFVSLFIKHEHVRVQGFNSRCLSSCNIYYICYSGDYQWQLLWLVAALPLLPGPSPTRLI